MIGVSEHHCTGSHFPVNHRYLSFKFLVESSRFRTESSTDCRCNEAKEILRGARPTTVEFHGKDVELDLGLNAGFLIFVHLSLCGICAGNIRLCRGKGNGCRLERVYDGDIDSCWDTRDEDVRGDKILKLRTDSLKTGNFAARIPRGPLAEVKDHIADGIMTANNRTTMFTVDHVITGGVHRTFAESADVILETEILEAKAVFDKDLILMRFKSETSDRSEGDVNGGTGG